jgi:broad specificity phosphatase PhoE
MSALDIDWTKSLYAFDVIFVRHAESFNNTLYDVIREKLGPSCSEEDFVKEEMKLRQSDSDLSRRGYEQTSKLRSFLKNGGWSNIVKDKSSWLALSSPMKRCLLTADAINNGLGVPVTVDPQLYETGGAFDENGMALRGICEAEVLATYPGYTCLNGMQNGFFSEHKVKESDPDFDERAYLLSERLWQYFTDSVELQKRGETKFLKGVVVVAHGNLLSAIINCLLTQSRTPRMGLFLHENSGYSHVELHYEDVRRRRTVAMKQLNDHAHLMADHDSFANTNPMRCGNHTTNDHWIQEFFVKKC